MGYLRSSVYSAACWLLLFDHSHEHLELLKHQFLHRLLHFPFGPFLYPDPNEFLNKSLQYVVTVFKLKTFNLLQLCNLNYGWVFIDLQLAGLKLKQLFALCKEHILLSWN